jgi:hypothetical protein
MISQTPATNLMTDIDKRFDGSVAVAPVRYISADEMAYIRARAVTLRAQAGRDFFRSLAGLFRSRPAAPATGWTGPAVTAR